MRTNTKRGALGLAFAALAGTVLAVPGAASAAPVAGSTGPATMDPSSGTGGTFTLTPSPVPANCGGDTATDGYTHSTFIAPLGTDISTLSFTGIGPSAPAIPALTTSGSPHINVATAPSTGQIINQPVYTLDFYPAGTFADGDYIVGYACHLNGTPTEWWTETATFTNTGGGTGAELQYTSPAVVPAPDTPTIDTVTPADGELQVAFTPADARADDFELTATPQGGGAPVVVTGATSPITVSGLTNFTTYDLSLVARNAAGNSAPATGTGTPEITVQVQNLSATPGQESITVSFDAVTGATDYEIVSDTPAGTVLTAGATSFEFTGLDASTTYNFTVTPVGVTGAAGASISAVPNPNSVIYQTISVERPEGALVLTQECGTNGDLADIAAVSGFPGFPFDTGVVAADDDPTRGAPSLDPGEGDNDDPLFGSYPAAGSYPTWCDLNLGTAQLVLDGPLSGQYYAAQGVLNQVSVLDTRDDDAGWTVTGTQQDLVNGTEVLSGNYVGWIPQVTSTSDPAQPGEYDQIVTAGPRVLPGDGVNGGTGLADGQTLASAIAGQGLGLARLDAHVQVLIPISNDAGVYSGDLTLTIV